MHPEYSDYDTERASAAERSSAGAQTQHLSPQGTIAQPARGRNNLAGLVLVAVGVLLLLARMTGGSFGPASGEFTGGMVLFTIASCFLFFAFWRRIYALVIPGSILAGLAIGVPFASLTNGVSVLWGLALGFLAILVLGRSLFNVHSNWPVFPAVPLFAVGTIVAISQLPSLFVGGVIWLPLLLIGAGLYLGWRRRP